MQNEFIEAIKKHQSDFDLTISDEKIASLASYYEIIQKHNKILHLVAPCSPQEFAVRHILESLSILEFLPQNARFADVGTGAGLPSIPCLIMRDDLRGFLIESKSKKAVFLRTVLSDLNLETRAEIINRQFEEVQKPLVSFVLCRALDKFPLKLPRLIRWSGESSLLFFGGSNLRERFEKLNIKYQEKLLPKSERRYLFYVKN